MVVTINGEKREIADGLNVQALLSELGLTDPLAVELNRRICPKRMHSETPLRPADVLEIVTIVGGG